VGSGAVANWRIATLNCVEQLKFEEKQLSIQVARYINDFFKPLISAEANANDKHGLETKVVALCKDAFTLRIAMRKSKGNYRCEVLPHGTLQSKNEDIAEAMEVEGGKDAERSDVIMFTLFGALTKQPEDTAKEKIVLEKAHVVLKRQE
jgi:hypothetical protein